MSTRPVNSNAAAKPFEKVKIDSESGTISSYAMDRRINHDKFPGKHFYYDLRCKLFPTPDISHCQKAWKAIAAHKNDEYHARTFLSKILI